MPLEEYNCKRDFKKTAEPRGAAGAGDAAPMFVIQKHDASRLHYDFRLEMDGVLKSWAVPKGPSFDPADKRLAVHVEDHPVSYGDFEGTIPEGEYGGGTVMLWDHGTWEPIEDAEEGYRKGSLKFRLHGTKLSGAWALVRMARKSESQDNWLLIKEKDELARPGEGEGPVKDGTNSVKTGRSMDEIAGGKPARSRGAAATSRRTTGAATLQPEMATLVESVPAGDGWIHEIKYDGYRAICTVRNGEVIIRTRNGNDWTARFPTLAKALRTLKAKSVVLDGEIVVVCEDGTTSFQSLQNALRDKTDGDLVYYAFDLLERGGEDLSHRPLVERKRALEALLSPLKDSPIRYSQHVVGQGNELHNLACRHGLEGIISKKADSAYRAGRGLDWRKVKCRQEQEMVIGGYTDPQGGRTQFGALLLGAYDSSGKLVYAGKVGTGFNERTLKEVHTRLKRLRLDTSRFAGAIPASISKSAHWVRPELVAQIEFANWTSDGMLRQAVFLGLREDKPAGQVVRESAQAVPAATADSGTVVAGVTISHPDRVVDPASGITKRELAVYYEAVGDRMLPHLIGRPLTLVRCPGGVGAKCFFQKNIGADPPEHIQSVDVETDDGPAQYAMVEDAAGLVELVQRGATEFHTWGSRSDRLQRPDRIIFDLDPDTQVGPERVIEAAFGLRRLLEDLGLQTFVKTTGGKGLHIVAPIARRQTWEEVKDFSRAVAERMVAWEPEGFTSVMTKARRAGKIYIDYQRNGEGATAVAAFSTRARPGLPVSVPIAWDALNAKMIEEPWTARTLPSWLATQGKNPWAGYADAHAAITAAMRKSLNMH